MIIFPVRDVLFPVRDVLFPVRDVLFPVRDVLFRYGEYIFPAPGINTPASMKKLVTFIGTKHLILKSNIMIMPKTILRVIFSLNFSELFIILA